MSELDRQTKEGLGYGAIIAENIWATRDDYDAALETLAKEFNKDEVGFLKNAGVGVYEGAKDFLGDPIGKGWDTIKDVASEVATDVTDLFTKSLNTRLVEKYGVTEEEATSEQKTEARESVLGDVITLSSLAPVGGVAVKGVQKAADIAKRIEVDPNALGSTGGNIKLKPKVETDTVKAAGLTDEDIAKFRKPESEGGRGTSPEFRKSLKGKDPELQNLALQVYNDELPVNEYRARVDEVRPIRLVSEVPKPATHKEALSALNAGKRKSPMVGLNYDIPDGDNITARLDIDAYTDYDVWIPTLKHNGKTMYKPALVMKNVEFIQPSGSQSKKALKVAVGPDNMEQMGMPRATGNKAPFAVMSGKYVDVTDDEAFKYATEVFDSSEWIQIGYDPTRRGYFYDRVTGEPVLSAEEVIQVGHLVLAKKAVKGNADDFDFATGGLVTRGLAEKGIKTQEGMDMAKKRFQLDEDKADLNQDGLLSPFEKEKGEAIQKAEVDKDMDVLKAYDGKGIIPKDDPARQDLLDIVPGLQDGITIREGTGYIRYSPIMENGKFVGWEENSDGPVTLHPTKVGDDVHDIYYILDQWLPANMQEERPSGVNGGDMPDPPSDWKRDSENEFDDENKDSVDPPNNQDENVNQFDDENKDSVDPSNNQDENINQFDTPEKEKSWWENLRESIGFAHGGLMADSCGCGMSECMDCGPMMDVVGYDDVSGNPIPAGSGAENVRDDIPAALSSGEYVLPANVVRWHGLKHIQGMMDEAKMGLMSMKVEGQIHEIEEEKSHSEESDDADSEDADSTPKEGEKSSKKEIKTPEGNVIEVATIEVKNNSLPIKKKPKVAYAK